MSNKFVSAKFVSTVLAFILLLAATSAAMAKSPNNSHDVVNDGPITWSLPAGICATAPNGLDGAGQRHQVINTKVSSDGSTITTVNDVVKGTAWDSTGSYSFTYVNHSVEVVPADGGTHQITMVDDFVLNGNGSVGHMAIGFNWQWTYTPPADMWPPMDNWQQNSTRGDPLHCDPL